MPKLKTHRGTAKRFKVTGSGKIKRARAFTSHILTKKTPKRGRLLRTSALVDGTQVRCIKRLLGI